MKALGWLAARGRWLLVAGLVAGIAVPGLAEATAPAIVPLIALMLCLAAMREGPAAALPRPAALPRAMAVTLGLQTALPLAGGGVLWVAGLLGEPLALAAVLALAAAPITGSPGLAVMSGGDARVALRQLALGTALLPLTAAPVFALLPLFPDAGEIALAAGRLLALVALAALAAAILRARYPALAGPAARPVLDGLMSLAMALVVIGLMSAVGPALISAPAALAGTFALATAVYLVQTLGAWVAARRALPAPEALAIAIVAGNRNLALFLAAVPAEATAPLMIFVGCYQIPMYLTPFLATHLRTGCRR